MDGQLLRALHIFFGIIWAGGTLWFAHHQNYAAKRGIDLLTMSKSIGKGWYLIGSGGLVVFVGGAIFGSDLYSRDAYGDGFGMLMAGVAFASFGWILQLFAQFAVAPRLGSRPEMAKVYRISWGITAALVGLSILCMSFFRYVATA